MNEQPLLTLSERVLLMSQLCRAVQATGEHVLDMHETNIRETIEEAGHWYSTVDEEASNFFQGFLERELVNLGGDILEESRIPLGVVNPQYLRYPLAVCDAVEGSTNATRGLGAVVRRPILAGTSVVVLERPSLALVAASAFYDFASRKVFSSVRGEPGSFLVFVNRELMPPGYVFSGREFKQPYAAVAGYSHRNITARGEVESVLSDVGIRTTGGSRSSAQDLVDMICNQLDAYVDLRELFPGRTDQRDEVLHFWDVGGLLSVMDGLGFHITDAGGNNWQQHTFGDRLSLVVARPSLAQKIMRSIGELPFVRMPDQQEKTVITLPTGRQELG